MESHKRCAWSDREWELSPECRQTCSDGLPTNHHAYKPVMHERGKQPLPSVAWAEVIQEVKLVSHPTFLPRAGLSIGQTNRGQRIEETRWCSPWVSTLRLQSRVEKGEGWLSRGTDLLECQEGQVSRMKCFQATSDTERSPEVNIEEFPLYWVIRWPLEGMFLGIGNRTL